MRAASTLRVAIVFGTFPPERNGGADFVARFASALAADGADVHIVTSPSRGSPAREAVTDRVTAHRIVDDWTLPGSWKRARRRIEALLGQERVDVLHVFFPDSILQGRYQLPAALGIRRIPLVTTFWNLGLGRRSPPATRLAAVALLARSEVLSSHDPAYLKALRLGAGWAKPVRWLPVGNNLEPPAGPPRPRVDAEVVLGYFGYLDFTRGAEELFSALARLRRATDVELLMVGGDAGESGAYVELARRVGVGDAVRWTGWLPPGEAAAALAACDVCVLPYRRTSVGRSALAAAFELGLPTVLGGTPETIAPLRPGVHVALAPPGDDAALAATVARVLADPAERARLAAGARRAARLFAWPRIAAAALALYREAVSRRSKTA
jgi:glycosyltransferase involved in cell wall biosynthesis